ncbi:MAG TPA: SRPBCC domain-containing protein [Candidatus Limnocylindria bacterium]|nr:SRPBCC domain-containing protein [Candidatus Limnocylindria bacterium]
MTVTAIEKDPQNLTMTVIAEFDATPERVWQLWADPRKLERWWGPPEYPATFTRHELTPGARVEYHLTGPEGDTPKGYWTIVEVEPPHHIRAVDGFANEDGSNNDEMPGPGGMDIRIESIGDGRTRMSILNEFPSTEAMEALLAMGQEKGMRDAIGQIDAILAEDTVGAR